MHSMHKVTAVVAACIAVVIMAVTGAVATYFITQQNDISQDIQSGKDPVAVGCAHSIFGPDEGAICAGRR
jgi:hypothetical protein